MRSYRFHTASETKTVTIKPDYGNTMDMHMGLDADALQGFGPDGQSLQRMAGENRVKKNA
jgi:hypothetical protein